MGDKKKTKRTDKMLYGTAEVGRSFSEKGGVHSTKKVHSVSADQVGGGTGLRYYSGEGSSRSPSMSSTKASFDARVKMATAPSDSIKQADVDSYLKPPKKKRTFKIFGRKD